MKKFFLFVVALVGTFNVPDNIDKSVRIYGAGMEDDAATNIAKTYLVKAINIKGVLHI